MPTVQAAESDDLRALGSIYFATELLRGKIDATLYLNEPNRAYGGETRFELHRMITKYFRIYRWQAEQKHMTFETTGACFATVIYRPEAVGVVVQALLDNLVKYAPAGSPASIHFVEESETVRVEFRSLGPKIMPSEISRIFTAGFRGEAARQYESSGLGFGLAAAKSISDTLDLELDVGQEGTADPGFQGSYATTFNIRLRRAEIY
jgi:signal transduction histidine kinase